MTFPDLPHLRQLQNDLWCWPKSRSAVMVGAGLSLNAEPLPGVTTRFPTWRQLVRAMFDELHPPQFGETSEEVLTREALQQLGGMDREILLLREFEQLSYAEIAELLDLPVNTVRSRLFRARAALRKLLEARPPSGDNQMRKQEEDV